MRFLAVSSLLDRIPVDTRTWCFVFLLDSITNWCFRDTCSVLCHIFLRNTELKLLFWLRLFVSAFICDFWHFFATFFNSARQYDTACNKWLDFCAKIHTFLLQIFFRQKLFLGVVSSYFLPTFWNVIFSYVCHFRFFYQITISIWLKENLEQIL